MASTCFCDADAGVSVSSMGDAMDGVHSSKYQLAASATNGVGWAACSFRCSGSVLSLIAHFLGAKSFLCHVLDRPHGRYRLSGNQFGISHSTITKYDWSFSVMSLIRYFTSTDALSIGPPSLA